MKKSKKLFLVGKVRDIEAPEFIEELKNDIVMFLGSRVNPEVFIADANTNQLRLVIGVSSSEGDVTAKSIPLSIVYLLNGENNSFTPKHPSYTGPIWPGFENCNVFIEKEEFAATYKANNKFYGGSRVKSIDVESDRDYGIIVKIDF